MALLINGERIEDDEITREAQTMRQSFEQIPLEQRERRGLDGSQLERRTRSAVPSKKTPLPDRAGVSRV